MGDSVAPVTVKPAAARATFTSSTVRSRTASSRTTPRSVSSWADSNCGFTRPMKMVPGRLKRGKRGASAARPMKDTSMTMRSKGAPRAAGSASLIVGALEDGYPRILADLPGELAVVHIERRHARGAGLQQAVGEAAGGRADVQAVHTVDALPEGVQRPLELLAAAGDELLASANENVGCGRYLDRGTRGVDVVHAHLARHDGPQRRPARSGKSPRSTSRSSRRIFLSFAFMATIIREVGALRSRSLGH